MKIHPQEKGREYPVLIGRTSPGPPEDCGGIPGCSELVAAMKKKGSEDYKRCAEWFGGPYNPKEFDMDGINSQYFDNFKAEMERREKMYYR